MSQIKKPFNIESFFRKRIKAAEDAGASQPWNEPDEGVWDQIEQVLPDQNPKRYRLLPWFFGIVLLGVAAWLLLQNRALKQEIALLEKQTAEVSPDMQASNQKSDETSSDDIIHPTGNSKSIQKTEVIEGLVGKEEAQPSASKGNRSLFTAEEAQQSGSQEGSNRGINLHSESIDFDSRDGESALFSGNSGSKLSQKTESEFRKGLPGEMTPVTAQSAANIRSRVYGSINPLPAAKITLLFPQEEIQEPAPASLPNLQLIEPVQHKKNTWQLSVAYEPSFAKLKNTTQYPAAPEFRGIDDLGVWSDAFSVRLSKELRNNLRVFAGIRYGAYQYQTAYYIALPYDPLLEVEGRDGNFTSDFSHSFPSPVGDMEANFGLLRLAEDDIEPQTLLNLDMHARHRLKLVEIPFGISKSFNVTNRFGITGSLSAIPGIVTGKESSAYAFESHHMAMHHRYSGFRGKSKSYNHIILSGGFDLTFSYQIAPQISVFAGGGYQAGLTNVYSDLNVHSKIRAYRLSFGMKNQF